MLEVRGRYKESQDIVNTHLAEQEAKGAFIVEARDLLACSNYHQGAFALALDHASKGIEAARGDERPPLSGCFGENPAVGCYTWAALSLWFLGHPEQALVHARRGVALAESPGQTYSLANAWAQLACLHQLRQEPLATEEWATQTIDLGERQGFAHRVAVGQVFRGWARGVLGRTEEGLAELRIGLDAASRIGVELGPYFLALLAEILASQGNFDEALLAVDNAERQVQAARSFFYEAELWRLRGTVLLEGNRPDRHRLAEECFNRAIAIATRQNARSLLLRAAMSRVTLESGAKQIAEIRGTLAPVYDAFREGFDLVDLQKAARLMQPDSRAIQASGPSTDRPEGRPLQL